MDSEVLVEAVGEEDEEFDWEAAVREIDLACKKSSNPSASFSSVSSFHSSSSLMLAADDASIAKNNLGGLPYSNIYKPVASKQSTLDKFFERPEPRPPPENQTVANQSVNEFVDGDDKSPFPNIELEAANTWIYPVNVPLREYQFAITKTALFSNTLVALPTGLGKTLIAAVVMYNYFRWFPEGKIVFAAPSRPLVMQQIEACHNVVGIPQEWTIDMTGRTSPSKRAILWKSKRVFFLTPQVLEKDIQSGDSMVPKQGTCLVNYLVCLVIDEAHRALGNYSYCVAVRELMALPVQMRILALTATPGSKTQAIQSIIDNLQISTLEYRNESDVDVSPYVHNRKVDLIEVPLGQDVVEINKCLLDVIRPYAVRLNSLGLLQNRDYQTLSPCDLLISRDKFRQAPPPGLRHVNHGDVEACFAALITLYHIRKLLTSHGIRPAYEMLEEKLRQGSFARLMSKNEDIRKAKLLMQQSLSRGAPSPKLSKMLEVLVDHFNMKDPRASRVIVFSNFRRSVRDIMNALSHIGDVVNATEFIGQSSGKALKGQSQKVQQAVLEKFRAGGYNVIVATSIGEEGLDIMEVDLVICFDANVSPLRMIQRMGRTGRKHDGRVVVLACEGSELKGYMRKQANGRSIRKHMRNGGMNSFNFHPSPRMIPHVFKPEVQFVEMSIKQFIPRGKKLRDENAPPFQERLSPAETDLLAKYFSCDREDTWRPSLIEFPHFQALPSKVNKIMHSHRTRMFIDAMQHLQEATFPEHSKSIVTDMQDAAPLSEREGVDTAVLVDDDDDDDAKDLLFFDDVRDNISQRIVKDPVESPTSTLKTTGKDRISELCLEGHLPKHHYLFGSEFVSVDALGKVFIMPVPSLSSYVPDLMCKVLTKTEFLNAHEGQPCLSERPNKFHNDLVIQASQERHLQGDTLASPSCKFKQGKSTNTIEKNVETQTIGKDLSGEEGTRGEAIEDVEIRVLSDEDVLEDVELSPRLTNFIKSGVVPESPVNDQRMIEEKSGEENVVPTLSSPTRLNDGVTLVNSSSGRRHSENRDCNALNTSTSNDAQTPEKEKTFTSKRDCTVASPLPEGWRTPLANLTNSAAIKDWQSCSREKSENVGQARKFKRLRRAGDCTTNCNRKTVKQTSTNPVVNPATSLSRATSIRKRHLGGKNKCVDDVSVFIDEEAEVSSEAELSADEELGDDSYEDSFIDDRTNPTASTQTESSKVDMIAIYRRSLLSQSPIPGCLLDLGASSSSPDDSVGPVTKMCESRSSSDKSLYLLQTPPTNSTDKSARKSSVLSHTNQDRTITNRVADDVSIGQESMIESRKRKFGSYHSGNIRVINLEKEFEVESEIVEREEESLQQPSERKRGNAANEVDTLDDDDDAFYATLDFDAVEAQATRLLKHKPRTSSSEVKQQETTEVLLSNMQSNGVENNAPSFDLGLL